MKTAVTVLQEMMIKMGLTPEYECIAQTGPQHQALFDYRCIAHGIVVTASARSKKEAKQEVARLMLQQLSMRGHPVPPPYRVATMHGDPSAMKSDGAGTPNEEPPVLHTSRTPATNNTDAKLEKIQSKLCKKKRRRSMSTSSSSSTSTTPIKLPRHKQKKSSSWSTKEMAAAAVAAVADTRSYVALLKELCEEYRLAGAEYELVGDTGPPHLRHFTVRVRIGQHERFATSTTKKAARQLAAEKLYTYLRENLARVTGDFNEEDALMRAHEKAMERFVDSDEPPRRVDLGQVIADYHLGLTARIEEDTRARCVEALAAARGASPERALRGVAAALRLDVSYSRLARAGRADLCVLELSGCSPDLAFAAPSDAAAAATALRYVRRALLPVDPAEPDDPEPPAEPRRDLEPPAQPRLLDVQ